MSTEPVACMAVKLDIPAHLEMLQEHACRLGTGAEMISTAQVITRHEQLKVGQIAYLVSRQGKFIMVNLLPFSSIFVPYDFHCFFVFCYCCCCCCYCFCGSSDKQGPLVVGQVRLLSVKFDKTVQYSNQTVVNICFP